jgi:hypothetical protein
MTLENHNPRNMRPGFQIRAVLLLLLALGVTWTAQIESADANANGAPSAAGAKPHKIQVSDPFRRRRWRLAASTCDLAVANL